MIKSLKINGLRCFESVSFEFSPHLNFIFGPNGVGKTSILEAIYLLGMGRSFRTRVLKRLIKNQTFVLSADLILKTSDLVQLTFSRNLQSEQRVCINGKEIQTLSELPRMLPLQLLNPDTHGLLTDGPKWRRSFLNWGVFHVEPQFSSLYQRFQRAHKQRNMFLQQSTIDKQVLDAWNLEFVKLSEKINAARTQYVFDFVKVFNNVRPNLTETEALSLEYDLGWDDTAGLNEVLEKNYRKERLRGVTLAGPHRADLKISYRGMPAQDILSRGEQKLLVYALHLAQGALFKQQTGVSCLYLIDDLSAELDEKHREKVITFLSNSGHQIIMTGLYEENDSFLSKFEEMSMFHVKQNF